MDNSPTKPIKEEFLAMCTREDVAALLDIKVRSLRYFLYKRRPESMYHAFEIPKKNGDPRRILAPNRELKEIQRKLAKILIQVYQPKVCVYGFINNKSFVGNAKQHEKRNLVLNIDLKDFFSQIHFGRIRGMLMKKPYVIGEEAATTIAQIACCNGILPQGAPSSPILTNMICAPLDNSLVQLAKYMGCVYTRYADDITFSTNRKMFEKTFVYEEDGKICIGKKLASILKGHSFLVNQSKIALRPRNNRQEVTGLTVNLFPNLRRGYIKQLRAILYHCQRDGVDKAAQEYVLKERYPLKESIKRIAADPKKINELVCWFERVIVGKINFIRQVKGDNSLTYLSFAKKFNEISDRANFNVNALMTLDDLIAQRVFILECECGNVCEQGSGFYLDGIGLLTSSHLTEKNEIFKVYKYADYNRAHLGIICKTINEISSDVDIDYALFKLSVVNKGASMLKFGNSKSLKIGDKVIVVGYPNHQEGNSPYIQTCSVTSKKQFHKALFYSVSGRIAHGASGGVVLNEEREVVGIIKGGIVSLSNDDNSNENQGFVPIHLILEHLHEREKIGTEFQI